VIYAGRTYQGREPEFSEGDIQCEQLGPRGMPGKPSPAKMTPQAEKNTAKDPDTGHTKALALSVSVWSPNIERGCHEHRSIRGYRLSCLRSAS
jgi:hypothetical protein